MNGLVESLLVRSGLPWACMLPISMPGNRPRLRDILKVPVATDLLDKKP